MNTDLPVNLKKGDIVPFEIAHFLSTDGKTFPIEVGVDLTVSYDYREGCIVFDASKNDPDTQGAAIVLQANGESLNLRIHSPKMNTMKSKIIGWGQKSASYYVKNEDASLSIEDAVRRSLPWAK